MVNLQVVGKSKGVSAPGISAFGWWRHQRGCAKTVDALAAANPAFLKPADPRLITQILDFSKTSQVLYDDIVVLGIGGSALGAIFLDTALRPWFSDRTKVGAKKSVPRLTVLDNIDPALLLDFEKTLNWSKTLFLVISKSGETAETIAQFLYFQQKASKMSREWARRFVLVTDADQGWLRQYHNALPEADRGKMVTFSIPKALGGRFSVLSVVGLLPAALVGIDIVALVAGARSARPSVLKHDITQNVALRLASYQYLNWRRGRRQNVMFVYAHKLRYLADWYRQLLAESIGKEHNRRGRRVRAGITPVSALGVTDQHSQTQLYLAGPNDKFYLFVDVEKSRQDAIIPADLLETAPHLQYLKHLSFAELLRTEERGTLDALAGQGRPVARMTLSELDARELGRLILILEASVGFLAEMMDINAYDQPAVEISKQITREILNNRQ